MFEYLLILLCLFFISFWLENRYHIHLYHNRRERLVIVGIFFIIGVVWDSIAVYRGHWTFLSGKNVGIYFGVLPFEEYLFFLVIPFMIITLYKILHSMLHTKAKVRRH